MCFWFLKSALRVFLEGLTISDSRFGFYVKNCVHSRLEMSEIPQVWSRHVNNSFQQNLCLIRSGGYINNLIGCKEYVPPLKASKRLYTPFVSLYNMCILHLKTVTWSLSLSTYMYTHTYIYIILYIILYIIYIYVYIHTHVMV